MHEWDRHWKSTFKREKLCAKCRRKNPQETAAAGAGPALVLSGPKVHGKQTLQNLEGPGRESFVPQSLLSKRSPSAISQGQPSETRPGTLTSRDVRQQIYIPKATKAVATCYSSNRKLIKSGLQAFSHFSSSAIIGLETIVSLFSTYDFSSSS